MSNPLTQKKKRKAIKLLEQNQVAEAREIYLKLVKDNARDAESWYMLGTLEGRLGNLEAAGKHMQEALNVNPGLAEAWLGLGQVQELRHELDAACDAYVRAFSIKPDLSVAYVALARVCFARKDYHSVIKALDSAFKAGVDRRQYLREYAAAMAEVGMPDRAAEYYQEALTNSPGNTALLLELAGVYLNLELNEEAMQCYQQVMAQQPDSVLAKLGMAKALRQSGRRDEAIELLRPLLDAHPDDAGLLSIYSRLSNIAEERPEMVARLEALLQQASNDQEREIISFELGRLYDAGGEYDRAFSCFKLANDLHGGYCSHEQSDRYREAVQAAYTCEALAKAPRSDCESEQPLFIVGMPRSGTTLVEQILACHSQVFGAGEIPDLSELIYEWRGGSENTMERLDALTMKELNALAEAYIKRINQRAHGERYISNKMPANYNELGRIALLFPQAKIIHCVRHPVDTCLSCYFQSFEVGHDYSNRLEDLVHAYRHYQQMMTHWKAVLDLPILDVHYEELVADQEGQSRRMLEFLGLEWEEACLNFHQSQRVVLTSSQSQVNKPIYTSSLSRWRNYEKHLGPLKALLA